jgi:septal ring factor EnvC (AmiA/AmiB activator)
MTDDIETLALSRAFVLLAIAADPKGTKARLEQIATASAELARAQAKLETERAEHARKVAADTAAMDEREQKLRARAVDLMVRENAMAETAKIRGLSDDRFHLDPNLGPGGRSYSGLTRAHEVE